MTSVYSSRLAAVTVAGDGARHALFTVPSGKRVVVRYLTVAAATATGAQLLLYIGVGGPEVFRADTSAASGGLRFDSRIVVHEGESLQGRATVQATIVAAFGYVLDGAGGPLAPSTLPAS